MASEPLCVDAVGGMGYGSVARGPGAPFGREIVRADARMIKRKSQVRLQKPLRQTRPVGAWTLRGKEAHHGDDHGSLAGS